MDPLLVLRQCLKQGTAATLHDNDGSPVNDLSHCVFFCLGGLIYPRDTPTNYRSKRGTGDCYLLDAVWFMLERREGSYGEYMQEARRLGVGVVSLVDRKDLIGYLEEEQRPDECPAIDTSLALPKPQRSFTATTDEGEGAIAGKLLQQPSVSTQPPPDGSTLPLMMATAGSAAKRIKSRPAQSRESPLLCAKDFSPVLEVARELYKTLAAPTASTSAVAVASSKPSVSLIEQIASANQPGRDQPTRRRPDTTPATTRSDAGVGSTHIIIVPAIPSSLLTMLNAPEFLSASRFLSTAEAKSQGIQKQNSVTIEHKFGSRAVKFQLIDNPNRLSPEDWKRVVAVFVQGNLWQFKGWKWESPADLFQNVRGFSLEFDDASTDPKIQGWNVQRLRISRSRRHLDSTAAFQFWSTIEELLRLRRILC